MSASGVSRPTLVYPHSNCQTSMRGKFCEILPTDRTHTHVQRNCLLLVYIQVTRFDSKVILLYFSSLFIIHTDCSMIKWSSLSKLLHPENTVHT